MSKVTRVLCAAVLISAVAPVVMAEEAHLMRWADIHDDLIVFTYEDDLWTVPAAGGDARRITNHPGSERYAKFSPDGSMIAFTGSYDGGRDVYVMDVRGGVPTRLTFHPSNDRVLGWHPSGDRVMFRSRRIYPINAEQVYLVSVDGGMPAKLPVPRAGLATLSGDGSSLAYNRISREDRTWKRYQGGMAQDIWVARLDAGEFRRVTDWPGSDNFPMWSGDSIYFNSDREGGTLNIHRYDVPSGTVAAVTSYTDYDVKYPSVGPGAIVYQYGERLHVLDLASGQSRAVDVRLGSDRVPIRAAFEGVGKNHGSFRVSPDGDKLLLEARGEILSIPTGDGEAENLTRTSGSREKNAVWSPDGTQLALVSDKGGEEAVWLVDQDGQWKKLAQGSPFLMPLTWSPDGKYLLFSDNKLKLNLVNVSSGKLTVIDRSDVDDAWERWGVQDYVWSPDSRFIAYTKMEPSLYESIFVYSMNDSTIHRVTEPVTNDWSPSFSPDGKYLYFLSNRTFSPIMGFVDQNHIFLDMTLPYVVVLEGGQPSPFGPSDAKEKDDEDGDEVKVAIDFDGLADRVVAAEGAKAGNYFRLEATDNGFLYLAKTEPEFLKYQNVNDHTSDTLELHHFDLAKASSKKLMDGITNYHLSDDRSKMVYRAGSKYGIVDTGSEGKVGDGAVALDGVKIKVHRSEEFEQIFDEAWRIQRDWFYDPGMHGVDWNAIRDKYRPLVASCGNRADLNYLIGEMIGELNIGHTYVYGGDFGEPGKRVRVGLLGADFDQPDSSAFHRISHIVPGTSWRPSERSPLMELGCGVEAGDYLIAIDGEEVSASDNVFSRLEDKVGRTVTVSYNGRPNADGAQACTIEPIGSEFGIRYREWVDTNRAKVAELSGGTIGYMHLPAMMQNGLIEFAREWYPNYTKKGFIIDERYNGGGFVGDMIIDRLERELWAYTQPREGITLTDPERAFNGHLVVLINEDTGSNGEYFAQAIRTKGLATVIGRRTWGGAVGIEPHQDVVDGGTITPPQFGLWSLDGREWLIEGYGVDPDIDVENPPAEVLAGKDAQLTAAIEYLQQRMSDDPRIMPEPPPYPDKSK